MTLANPLSETEIIVQGYSERYVAAVRALLQIEGGFSNDPADRGGATKYGISLRFLASEGVFDEDGPDNLGDGKADFDLDFNGDIDGQDIRALTKGDAVYLYHRCFWRPLQAQSWPRPLGEMLFDQAVNGGAVAARKLLQRAVNACLLNAPAEAAAPPQIRVDGVIDDASLSAFAWALAYPGLGMPALLEAFRDAVRARYRAIVAKHPSQQRFLRGWLARAERLGR